VPLRADNRLQLGNGTPLYLYRLHQAHHRSPHRLQLPPLAFPDGGGLCQGSRCG
jgi:hypothetical protein